MCLHSCFGSKRDVLSLALFQPPSLGLKCQLVHERYTLGACFPCFNPELRILLNQLCMGVKKCSFIADQLKQRRREKHSDMQQND